MTRFNNEWETCTSRDIDLLFLFVFSFFWELYEVERASQQGGSHTTLATSIVVGIFRFSFLKKNIYDHHDITSSF